MVEHRAEPERQRLGLRAVRQRPVVGVVLQTGSAGVGLDLVGSEEEDRAGFYDCPFGDGFGDEDSSAWIEEAG